MVEGANAIETKVVDRGKRKLVEDELDLEPKKQRVERMASRNFLL